MEAWWIILAVLVLAGIGVGYLVQRRARRMERREGAAVTADRDFVAERETSRMGNLSAEDQAWQSASLEKDRANQQQNPPTV
jgi:membrane protein implicated in regulation of membrane protease activity